MSENRQPIQGELIPFPLPPDNQGLYPEPEEYGHHSTRYGEDYGNYALQEHSQYQPHANQYDTASEARPADSSPDIAFTLSVYGDGSWKAAGSSPQTFTNLIDTVSGSNGVQAGENRWPRQVDAGSHDDRKKRSTAVKEQVGPRLTEAMRNKRLQKLGRGAIVAFVSADLIFVGGSTAEHAAATFAHNHIPFVGKMFNTENQYALNGDIPHNIRTVATGPFSAAGLIYNAFFSGDDTKGTK